MKTLQTIEEAHKMFDTQGSHPLIVTCEDFRDWVCVNMINFQIIYLMSF